MRLLAAALLMLGTALAAAPAPIQVNDRAVSNGTYPQNWPNSVSSVMPRARYLHPE